MGTWGPGPFSKSFCKLHFRISILFFNFSKRVSRVPKVPYIYIFTLDLCILFYFFFLLRANIWGPLLGTLRYIWRPFDIYGDPFQHLAEKFLAGILSDFSFGRILKCFSVLVKVSSVFSFGGRAASVLAGVLIPYNT